MTENSKAKYKRVIQSPLFIIIYFIDKGSAFHESKEKVPYRIYFVDFNNKL